MTVETDAQTHINVVDSNGNIHYVECMKCAFKLVKNYAEINITANCDWYGPNYVITINLKNYVNTTTVNPPTAMLIDGGCTKNRIVYNQDAAEALLAHDGISPYLAAIQNVTIPTNATVMTLSQAAIKYAYTATPEPTSSPSPSPTPIPTGSLISNPTPTVKPTASPTPVITSVPTVSPAPSTIQQCEACGMEANANAQVKYKIKDGSGAIHYVECFMCALNLINDHDTLTISTYCDWYGPNYPIIVESSKFGKAVNVTPSTAIFLNGGSCVINRVAYNQTAADELLANGYSKHTLPEQHYDLPTDTKVATVANSAIMPNENNVIEPSASGLMLIGVIAGVAIIAVSIAAYKKFKLT